MQENRKLNHKQLKFCVNIGKGMSYIDAFKDAYKPTGTSNYYIRAWKIAQSPYVQAEIKRLREKFLDVEFVDKFLLLTKYWETYNIALERGHTAVMNSTLGNIAKLIGLNEEKTDTEVKIIVEKIVSQSNT